MRTVVIIGDRNSPGINPKTGKPWADWSGEFKPRALQFAKHHGVALEHVHQIDLGMPKPQRTKAFMDVLRAEAAAKEGAIECIAVFDHGLHVGFPRFGVGLEDCAELAGIVASAKDPDLVFIGYACSLGSGALGGDGGFADKCRDALDAAGAVACKFIGHRTPGPASINPYCYEYVGSGHGLGGIGGTPIIAPTDPEWPAWKREMHRPGSTLWMDFPFMTRDEIRHSLAVPT